MSNTRDEKLISVFRLRKYLFVVIIRFSLFRGQADSIWPHIGCLSKCISAQGISFNFVCMIAIAHVWVEAAVALTRPEMTQLS